MLETDIELELLKKRFEKNSFRHPGIDWSEIESASKGNDSLLDTVSRMEATGGEPDVVLLGKKLYFVDMSIETPKGRRSVCYDEEARLSRIKFPPKTSAETRANDIGVAIVDESKYLELQKIGNLDLKTSSWLKTPDHLRQLGGALFGDKRYDRTFVYHNGADSYYDMRGFRGYIPILDC